MLKSYFILYYNLYFVNRISITISDPIIIIAFTGFDMEKISPCEESAVCCSVRAFSDIDFAGLPFSGFGPDSNRYELKRRASARGCGRGLPRSMNS